MSLDPERRACASDSTTLQTRKTSKKHAFFIKNQAKSLIFHRFPCQNLLGAADMLTAGPELEIVDPGRDPRAILRGAACVTPLAVVGHVGGECR